MKKKIKYILLSFPALIIFLIFYAFFYEPGWIEVNSLRLSKNPSIKIAHISDIHFKGNDGNFVQALEIINQSGSDFVCLTGDILENGENLEGAVELIKKFTIPVYAVPGNHELWHKVPLTKLDEACISTGGKLLLNNTVTRNKEKVIIHGLKEFHMPSNFVKKRSGYKRVLLTHYPQMADRLPSNSFSVILAGHSHGGQVRLPVHGSLMKPSMVGKYEMGLFYTKAGLLYVNRGLGTYKFNIRFLCRPEITFVEI